MNIERFIKPEILSRLPRGVAVELHDGEIRVRLASGALVPLSDITGVTGDRSA